MCTLVILHSPGMPLLLAANRLRQHVVTELGLGFLPILVFLGLLFLTLSIGLMGSCLIRI